MKYDGIQLQQRFAKWLPLLIVAVGVLSYVNSFLNPFIFDDETVIRKSCLIQQSIPLTLRSRFIVYLTFKLNHMLGGWNVADYHAVNLLIHILAGLLLYGIIKSTFLLPRLSSRYGKAAPYLAAVCASLWVVHPLQTESVTYICQRFESMMGMFFFLSLYCFIRGVDSKHKRFWYDASIAACAVGMGTKEVMISAPVMILLYDYVFVSGSFRRLFVSRWKVHSALFCTLGIRAFLQVFSFLSRQEAGMALISRISPLTYLFTQFGVIIHYLRLSVFPYPLCLDYGWRPAEGLGEVLVPGVCLSVLAIGTLWGLWRRPTVGFLGAWFFIILFPTSSIISVTDIAFEHRMYLPVAAIIVLLVTGIHQLFNWIFWQAGTCERSRTWIRILTIGLVLVVFGSLTILRNTDYRSQESMWRDVLAKRPHNLRAYMSLGVHLLKNRRHKEAEACFENTLNRLPKISDGSPRYDTIVYAKTQDALGVLKFHNAEYGQAEAYFREALRVVPEYVNAQNNLGLALKKQGKVEEAISEWHTALNIAGDNGDSHYCLGATFAQHAKYAEAIKHLEKALKLNPEMTTARIELAWLLATCEDPLLRNGKRAIVLVLGLRGIPANESVKVLDILGAASAADGNFHEALRYARSALNLAEKRGMSGLEPIEERINLYRQRIPHLQKKDDPASAGSSSTP